MYARKHFSTAGAFAVFAVTMLLEPVTRLVLALCLRDASRTRDTILAYGYLCRSLLACWSRQSDRGEVAYDISRAGSN